MNKLAIGVGTGRCGTKSLVRLLSLQAGTSVTHEKYDHKVRWGCPKNLWPLRLWENSKKEECKVVSDVAFYWTPHVKTFLDWGDEEDREVRVVGLKRDRQEVIESYDKWKPNSDHWSFHGYRKTLPDQWDHCYPCYDVDDKREGIGRFWDDVYETLEDIEDDRVKVFPTEYLNVETGVKEILEHVGYESPNVKVGVRVKAPSMKNNDSKW